MSDGVGGGGGYGWVGGSRSCVHLINAFILRAQTRDEDPTIQKVLKQVETRRGDSCSVELGDMERLAGLVEGAGGGEALGRVWP